MISVEHFLEPLPSFLDPGEAARLVELDRQAVRALLAKLEATDGLSRLSVAQDAEALEKILVELTRRAARALAATVVAGGRSHLGAAEGADFALLIGELRASLAQVRELTSPIPKGHP